MLWLNEWNKFVSSIQEKKMAKNDFEKLKSFKNRDDIHIRFANTEKIGINPNFSYDNPLGIYTYPLKQVWEEVSNNKILFAGDSKYIHVLKENPNARIVDPDTYTKEDFQVDIENMLNWKGGIVFSNLLSKTGTPSIKQSALKQELLKVYKNNKTVNFYFNVVAFDSFGKNFLKQYYSGNPEQKDNFVDLYNSFLDRILTTGEKTFTRLYFVGEKALRIHFQRLEKSIKDLETIFNEAVKPKTLGDAYEEWVKTQGKSADAFNNFFRTILTIIREHDKDVLNELLKILDVNISNITVKPNKETINEIIEIAEKGTRLPTHFGILWWMAWQGTKSAFEWSKMFLDIGIDACTDKTGTGIIHPNEPYQAVFINPRSYKRVDVMENFLLHDYRGDEISFYDFLSSYPKEFNSIKQKKEIEEFETKFIIGFIKFFTKKYRKQQLEEFFKLAGLKNARNLFLWFEIAKDEKPEITNQITSFIKKYKNIILKFFVEQDAFLEMAQLAQTSAWTEFTAFNKYLFHAAKANEEDEKVKNNLLKPLFPNEKNERLKLTQEVLLNYIKFNELSQEFLEKQSPDYREMFYDIFYTSVIVYLKKINEFNLFSKATKLIQKEKINAFGLRVLAMVIFFSFTDEKDPKTKEQKFSLLKLVKEKLDKFPQDEAFNEIYEDIKSALKQRRT